MKLICIVLGLVSLVAAAMYLMMPAGQLPGFFPGFEAGATNIHTKHGLAAGAVGIVLIAIGWFMGRR